MKTWVKCRLPQSLTLRVKLYWTNEQLHFDPVMSGEMKQIKSLMFIQSVELVFYRFHTQTSQNVTKPRTLWKRWRVIVRVYKQETASWSSQQAAKGWLHSRWRRQRDDTGMHGCLEPAHCWLLLMWPKQWGELWSAQGWTLCSHSHRASQCTWITSKSNCTKQPKSFSRHEMGFSSICKSSRCS